MPARNLISRRADTDRGSRQPDASEKRLHQKAATRENLPRSFRLARGAALVVACTWLPGILGKAIHSPVLADVGRYSGYAGLSWLLPGVLVGLALAVAAGRSGRMLVAVPASLVFGALFLLGAAHAVGG